ncbi:MAG TPA: glycosyltransferase family 39 protein [Anaerolineae bacterium]
MWQLDAVPPGWRDDELINSLIISQKVLNGQWAIYYPDASGHEALYHALNAVMLGLFGPNIIGIRLLSAILGTLTVPLTYVLARRLFGIPVALVAATALSLSFWSLMYSRIGLRHISLPLWTTAAFYFFWQGLEKDWGLSDGTSGIGDWRSEIRDFQSPISSFLLSAMFMGLGFYSYFASRGVPLILLAFCGYLWLSAPDLFRHRWRGLALMFIVTGLLALPLAYTLGQQPESEARVVELAVPLVEARAGNFAPLRDHVVTTLAMFHSSGDGEWLYNIPGRPVFGLVGAVFFWSGVAIALWHALKPLASRKPINSQTRKPANPQTGSLASAFLLLWWLAGIAPGFISVPPASLGHTITAQPAVFILAALPIWRLGIGQCTDVPSNIGKWRLPGTGLQSTAKRRSGVLTFLLAMALLFSIAWRDLPDYFHAWPQRGMVRFLYRADIHDVATYLNEHADLVDFGITGLLAGPWDRLALSINLRDEQQAAIRPRWYDPRRAVLLQPSLSFSNYPDVPFAYETAFKQVAGGTRAGGYRLSQVAVRVNDVEPVCFENGLCSLASTYDSETQQLELAWQVKRPLDLPPMPLISNPPPPGIYAGPRLLVFAHLVDAGGNFLAGEDGLWVDPVTLHPGDVFLQQHWPVLPEGGQPIAVVFGLYDPMSGGRILTEDGRDHLQIEIGD